MFLKVGVKPPISLPMSPFNCLEFQTKLFSELKNDVRKYLHSVEEMRADDGCGSLMSYKRRNRKSPERSMCPEY